MSDPPAYFLSTVSANTCGEKLIPGDSIFVSWQVSGGNPGYDSCFVSVRPISDLHDDDAYVAQVFPHPQCGGSSTNIIIPENPINSSFPFNGSEFTVRVNTGIGIYADSCIFKIARHRSDVTYTEITAILGLAVSFLSMAIASISLVTTRRDKAKEKDEENELREAQAAATKSIRDGNWPEAEKYCRSVMNKIQLLRGRDSPETFQAMEQLASIYDIQQKLAMMEELYRTLVRRGRRSLGPTNADTLKNHEKLADALFRQDKWSQAEVTLREILDLMGGLPADGPGNINIRRVLSHLAQAVENQMHWAEAEILYRQLLRMTNLAVDQNRTLYYQNITRLAGVLCRQGGRTRLEEAVRLYEEVNAYNVRARGVDSMTTARSRAELDTAQQSLAQEMT